MTRDVKFRTRVAVIYLIARGFRMLNHALGDIKAIHDKTGELMNLALAITLSLSAISLLFAVDSVRRTGSETLQILMNVAGIAGLVAAMAMFLFQQTQSQSISPPSLRNSHRGSIDSYSIIRTSESSEVGANFLKKIPDILTLLRTKSEER